MGAFGGRFLEKGRVKFDTRGNVGMVKAVRKGGFYGKNGKGVWCLREKVSQLRSAGASGDRGHGPVRGVPGAGEGMGCAVGNTFPRGEGICCSEPNTVPPIEGAWRILKGNAVACGSARFPLSRLL